MGPEVPAGGSDLFRAFSAAVITEVTCGCKGADRSDEGVAADAGHPPDFGPLEAYVFYEGESGDGAAGAS